MMKLLSCLVAEARADAFPTALGWIGAAHSQAGLLAVTLPCATEAAAWENLARELGGAPCREPGAVDQVRAELVAYARGERLSFTSPVDFTGYTPFQRDVLQAVAAIPYGKLLSYAEVARAVGRPLACRAVGQAVHINRTPVVVPCHRVINADRSLGGFGGGCTQKLRLLVHEGILAPGALSPKDGTVLPPVARVRRFLTMSGKPWTIIEPEVSTKTAVDAALALGVEVGQIAKSLLFVADGRPVLVVTSGDRRVDNERLKLAVGASRLAMADPKTVAEVTGFPVGGVSPVAHLRPAQVILDVSMRRFPVVYAAAGSPSSAWPVSFADLQEISGGEPADVC